MTEPKKFSVNNLKSYCLSKSVSRKREMNECEVQG